MTTSLTDDEYDLLEWLGREDLSQYGECYGRTFDSLCAKGLAKVYGPETAYDNPFIAKGRGVMFRAVSLTDAGLAVLRKEQLARARDDG